MKNIEMLPVSAEAKARIKEFASQYKRFAKLEIEVLSANDKEVIVKASQLEPVNGRYLTVKEIVDRVKKMFEGEIPETMKLHVRPVVIERSEIDNVTKESIKSEMERLGLRDKHLIQYLGITKSVISEIINGDKPLTKWHKATFYYFFKYYAAVNANEISFRDDSIPMIVSMIAEKLFLKVNLEIAKEMSGLGEGERKYIDEVNRLTQKIQSRLMTGEIQFGCDNTNPGRISIMPNKFDAENYRARMFEELRNFDIMVNEMGSTSKNRPDDSPELTGCEFDKKLP